MPRHHCFYIYHFKASIVLCKFPPSTYTEKYESIADDDRRIYAGMVENADEAIGNITEAMKRAG